jgi:ElaB/YqjD/DUF883 family membrane-anchored ribosome-binding protein
MAQEHFETNSPNDYKREGLGDKKTEGKPGLKSEVRHVASEVEGQAKYVGSQVAGTADTVLSSVGQGLNSLAETIRDYAPSEGAAESVAVGLQSGGDYLVQHGVEDIAKDLTDVVRKYPIASMWIGMGVGVLLGSALSRK